MLFQQQLLNKFSTEDFDKKSSQLISYWVNNEINLKALKDLINEEDISVWKNA